jgi:hypothetical protein
MKANRILLALLAAGVLLLSLGCVAADPGALTQVSSAFFDVPTSLTGASDPRSPGSRSIESDAMVRSTIGSYYAMVRGQVAFGVEAARSLKALLVQLEHVKIGDSYLLDSETSLTHTAADGRKYRWTTEAPGTFFLEVWAADGTKSLELRFTRAAARYSGTAVASPSSLGWAEPAAPAKLPDWVSVDFDTDSDGSGTARLEVSAEDFRYHGDLDPGLENALMVLTRDSIGVVRLGSVVRGDNSRHFVWNGYTRDASNVEVLNTGASSETRYYVAAGTATADNHATVYLGIPLAPVDATVFVASGVGSLVGDVFAARLNNDYDFDGPSLDPGLDHGHEIIDALNTINSSSPLLDFDNTAAETLAALVAAQGNLGTPSLTVDYLAGIMAVENPACFDSTTVTAWGAATPAGWPVLAEADARALLPASGQAAVDAMSISFEAPGPAGF